MRNLLKTWTRELARDDGAAGLIAVSLIVVVAFTALTIFLSNAFGPGRDLERLQAAERANATALDAVMVNFIQEQRVPCPDTNGDGVAETTCTGAGTISGRIPWSTLGISPDAALDTYGRYYTYVVSGDDDEQAMCESVDNDFGGAPEYTGNMTQPQRLEVRTTGATAGYYVPFAIISHGVNGRGGVSRGAVAPIAGATGSELANATTDPTSIYTGPYTSDMNDPFDDRVIVPSSAKLQQVCEALTPGGQANASFGDDFNAAPSPADDVDGDGFHDGKWSTGGGADAPTRTAGQAQFATSGTGYLATASGVNVVPSVRPIYVAAYWTPGADNNSFAIVTRGLPGATATNGVTFTFGPTVTITETGIGAPPTAGLDVLSGQRYLLEVYDNGSDVWGRATQVSDPTNVASVRVSGVTNDIDLDDRVVFANGVGSNRLDDVIVGYPMLSLETGSNPPATAPATNGSGGPNLTLEAWIRPTSLAGGSIVAQWDTAPGASDNSFRLYMSSGGAVRFAINDTTDVADDISTGISLASSTWAHIAVVFDGTSRTVTTYKDGQYVTTRSTALTTGIHAPIETIGFGADSVSTVGANNFDGQISDVRIWSTARTPSLIAECFNRRLGTLVTNCDTGGLVANWRMDPSTFAPALTVLAATGAGTDGDRESSLFTPSLSTYFRATSTTVCPSNKSGAYQCDFRTAGTTPVTVHASIDAVYAKTWGAGGNGGGGDGAGADFAGALISNTAVLSVNIGEGGAGNAGSSYVEQATRIDLDVTPVITTKGGETVAPTDVLSTLSGILTASGGVPDAANTTDSHYNIATLPIGQQNPGRGEMAAPVDAAPEPHNGAAVLLW